MITRLLPPHEWDKLKGTEAEGVIPSLRGLNGHALVVEDDGRVVGCWLLIPEWRAECLWVAPEKRGTASVGRRLLAAMKRSAHALGIGYVVTAAVDPAVGSMLDRVGAQKLPGEHYIWPLEVQ